MKVITLFATINAGVIAFTPQSSPRFATNLAVKQDEKGNNKLIGGAIAFFTGLATAGQIAFADPSLVVDFQPITDNTIAVEKQVPSSLMVSIGAPSFAGGSSFETLDFSLPSYGEATGDAKSSDAPKSAPSFSASFPELKLPGESSNSAVDEAAEKKKAEEAKKAEEEKAAAAKKSAEEDKVAKAKAKEEERIAKEKEAAEKAAAVEKKKAELEARKEAEKKKQEEMVARQKAAEEKEKAAAAAAAKAAEEEKAVTPAPAPKPAPAPAPAPAPEIKLPEIAIPAFTAPKFELPAVPAPAPPVTRSLDIPLPPTPPVVKPPVAPIVAVPSLGGASKLDAEDAPLESQEVRDAKAREAKERFNVLDQKAKDIEKQAKEAREVAKEANKEAKLAKDEACKTRPGGTVLCLRGFGSGY